MTSLLDQNDNNEEQFDQNKDYLEILTGPGGKFDKTKYGSEAEALKAMAKGKAESDAYIETLKRQQDELRADYTRVSDEARAQAKLKELIDQLEVRNQSLNDSNEPAAKNDSKPFNPEDLETLVATKIRENELYKQQDNNFKTVQEKLKEQFGVNYKTVLKERIDSLGLTSEDIDSLARKSPNAFFNTLGINQQERREDFNAPPRSNRRNDNFSPTVKKRTWAYYQDMKKNNPKAYFDPKTTVQMHNDAIELGAAFQDGDFHKY